MPGTQGKTLKDQVNIDHTVAGGCATKIYTKVECRRQTQASSERRMELATQ